MSFTLTRLPGLTPLQQDALRAKLAARLREGGDGPGADPVEGMLRLMEEAIREAFPREVNANPILVARLQAFSDELRRDGKPGMARDLDRMAGILFDLSRREHEAALLLDAYRFAAASGPDTALSRLGWAAAQDRGRVLAKGVRRHLEASFMAAPEAQNPAA